MHFFSTHIQWIVGVHIQFFTGNYYPSWCWDIRPLFVAFVLLLRNMMHSDSWPFVYILYIFFSNPLKVARIILFRVFGNCKHSVISCHPIWEHLMNMFTMKTHVSVVFVFLSPSIVYDLFLSVTPIIQILDWMVCRLIFLSSLLYGCFTFWLFSGKPS